MYINRKQIPYPHICQDFYITSYYILQVNILILSPVYVLGIIRKYEDKYEDSEFGSDISL